MFGKDVSVETIVYKVCNSRLKSREDKNPASFHFHGFAG